MKPNLLKSALLIVLGTILFTASAQRPFTPYDDLPGINKNYKPAFNTDFPKWARLLYDFPVNYFKISVAYNSSKNDISPELRAINRYFKIWQRNIEPFVLNDGTIQLPDLGEYYFRLQNTQVTSYKSTANGNINLSDWTFLGPKETFWLNESGSPQTPKSCPWQVNVYSFDVSATNNNILFCGTETGFVNKSTDRGLTWQLLAPDYYFGGSVTAVVIHPFNSEVVYVAAGKQIHRSNDGGNSWVPLLEVENLFFADRMKIDKDNPNKIFAAGANGIFVSSDSGITWGNPWANAAYDVEIKPNDPEIIFGLTRVGAKFSVIVSTDGGLTFETDPGFPGNINDVSGGLLAVTASNPDVLLAVMLSSDNTPFLYSTSLTTGTWDLLATGRTTAFPMDNGQGYFDLVLEVSPVDETLIFAGTTTLFKSVNGGQNFSAIGGYTGAFAIHPDIQDMRILPDGITWVATDGGFSLSTDNFTSTQNYFSRNNGLIGSDMWGFDQGWNEDIVVGGRYHNGNTALADFYGSKALRMGGAESPTGWVVQGKNRHVAFNDLGNGWILPPTAEAQPEGRFIFSKYPNMDEYGGRRGNMVFHPNYYGTIFLGEGIGFWKSTDMGVSWDLLYNFGFRVRYLQISHANPEVLYADVVNKGLYKSQDGGQSWELKPSLTSGDYGTSYWRGKTFIAISPYNENVIYTCLQNGTWSADPGQVFRSTDSGDTWENWTGNLSEYTKCMVIQPTNEAHDLVYLFSNAKSGQNARVFYRSDTMDDWEVFDNNYPAGMAVNMALPFFRDSKLRVAGGAGVWESPMEIPEFTPIINPWVEKPFYDCMTDTLFFNDHSLMNFENVNWSWEITPEPEYISNPNIRNPKVVLGSPETYSVNITITKNGEIYNKFIPDMVAASTCPSIEDCNNPAELPKDIWELLYVDSEETGVPGLAVMAFDDDPSTIWHTRWSSGVDPYPHEMQVDMGELYKLFEFTYLSRQDGVNGRIKAYELYISDDNLNWGTPVSSGEFENSSAPQTIVFDEPVNGQYFRLLALSEVNDGPWASAAEFSMVGCTDLSANINQDGNDEVFTAFPIPTCGIISVPLPHGQHFTYRVLTVTGKMVRHGEVPRQMESLSIDLGSEKSGVYFITLAEPLGKTYRIKIIKE